ncbi:hypothetical protein AVEN_3205-1 [Araneus ventricosus]|uniref:Uncharacterized protein n=1 Tax=Araneus ventricosus TaxID=182803 RepID=A0A4Y2M7W2_ARAVE|nr:hypothetical protein AVEN_3205-1 [Araneus ventricosus]
MFIDLKREFSSFRIDINTKVDHISKQIAPEGIARQPELQEPNLHEELVKVNLNPEVESYVSAVRNSSSAVKRVKSDSKLVINGASKISPLKSVDDVFAGTVPLKRVIIKKFPFWYSVETRRLLRRKEIVFRLLLRHRNPVFIDEFKSLRTSVKFGIKRDYGNYLHVIEKDLISEPKKFWSHFKKNNHLPGKLYYKDKCFINDIDITNAYVDYFCSVFKPGLEYDSNDAADFNGLGDFVGIDTITYDNVVVAIKELKSTSAIGHSVPVHINPSLRSPTAPAALPRLLRFPLERDGLLPLPRIYTGRISAPMARQSKWTGWIFRRVGNPNFRPRRSNSHGFFALTIGYDMEWANLLGVESS